MSWQVRHEVVELLVRARIRDAFDVCLALDEANQADDVEDLESCATAVRVALEVLLGRRGKADDVESLIAMAARRLAVEKV